MFDVGSFDIPSPVRLRKTDTVHHHDGTCISFIMYLYVLAFRVCSSTTGGGGPFCRINGHARSTGSGSPSLAMATKKASKASKSADSINARLQLVMKSGKYCLGLKTTLKTLRQAGDVMLCGGDVGS